MKFFKRFFVFLILLWLVSIPLAGNAGAGSFLYEIKVKFNDPILAWSHLTAEGRGDTYVKQFRDALDKYAEAVYKRDVDSELNAKQAIYIAWSRSLRHIANVRKGGNHKVADIVVSDSAGLIHGKQLLLTSLVSTDSIPREVNDFVFLDDLAEQAKQERQKGVKRFKEAFSQLELVRGTDDRMNYVEGKLKAVQQLVEINRGSYQEAPREELGSRLDAGKSYIDEAKKHISQDQYVDAYIDLDTANAIVLEVDVVTRDMKFYGVPVTLHRYEY